MRLKGHPVVDVGRADITGTADLTKGVALGFAPGVRLLQDGIETNIGIWHETGHEQAWIMAMDCPPTAATTRDDGLRWVLNRGFPISTRAASGGKTPNCVARTASTIWG